MSRFRLTESPEALPGSCLLCGAASRDFFVDTGLLIEFHGAVYFCSECLAEIANLAGYTTPEQTNKLHQEFEILSTEVYRLKAKENGLEVAIGGLVAAGFNLPDSDSDLPRVRIADEVSPDISSVGENQLGEGTGTSPEPSDDEELGELHADGSSDEPERDFSLDLGASPSGDE